jgi:hypothetical protein
MGAMPIVTIQVDDELLARARELAAARKMTVSEMLERLLRVVAVPPLSRSELPPLPRQAVGMLPTMTDEEMEQTLDEERIRKYGNP